jgi:hypothetical protein
MVIRTWRKELEAGWFGDSTGSQDPHPLQGAGIWGMWAWVWVPWVPWVPTVPPRVQLPPAAAKKVEVVVVPGVTGVTGSVPAITATTAITLTRALRLASSMALGAPEAHRAPVAPFSRLFRAAKSASGPPLHGYMHGPMHGWHITRQKSPRVGLDCVDIWFTVCKMPPTDCQMRHGHAFSPVRPSSVLSHRGSRT